MRRDASLDTLRAAGRCAACGRKPPEVKLHANARSKSAISWICNLCSARRRRLYRTRRPILTDEDRYARHQERFLSRVTKEPTGCWSYRGFHNAKGYGQFPYSPVKGHRRVVHAHRFSYQIHKGPITTSYHVHHTCFNRGCVNPAHLEAVSVTTNAFAVRPVSEALRGRYHCGHTECAALQALNYHLTGLLAAVHTLNATTH